MMLLECHRMTEDEKVIVSEWQYEGDYAIYNNPPYDEQKRKCFGFANPQNISLAFYEGDRLVGFTCLYEEASEVFFGTGVNPSLCGKGYGRKMTEQTIALSHEWFPGKPLYLEVRTWNERAVKCYQRAGFRIAGAPIVQSTHAGEGTFYHMVADQ